VLAIREANDAIKDWVDCGGWELDPGAAPCDAELGHRILGHASSASSPAGHDWPAQPRQHVGESWGNDINTKADE
jgi:hypothetical protein